MLYKRPQTRDVWPFCRRHDTAVNSEMVWWAPYTSSATRRNLNTGRDFSASPNDDSSYPSPEFFNPSDFPTFPESPWDDGLTTPALGVGAGMTPDIYTSPALMSFGDDFDSMPSLFDNLASEDCGINANSVPTSQSPPPPGSAANASTNMNLAVDLDTVHAIAAVNNPVPSSSPFPLHAQPAQPPRGQAQPPLNIKHYLPIYLRKPHAASTPLGSIVSSTQGRQRSVACGFDQTSRKVASDAVMLAQKLEQILQSHRPSTRACLCFSLGPQASVPQAALLKPLPSDFDLFREVDFVLNEIRRCYAELDKFWTEEIRRAAKALETRRVDPDDAKRWRDFKQALSKPLPNKAAVSGAHLNYQVLRSSIRPPALRSVIDPSQGPNLGAIASVLSPALATLEKTLQRVRASASIAFSPKNFALALRVGCGSTQNKEPCLTFFRRCISFAETIAASSAAFMTHPTFFHVRTSNNLQERVTALRTEAVDVSAESATLFQVPVLQRGTTHELNTLLEHVSSWIVFVDGLPNVPPGEFSVGSLHDLADAWEKGRASVRKMLAALTDDPLNGYAAKPSP
ncbi:hypothetical protein BC826DRAFT_1173855 [Russula brevipes]|nr:hypothetical protein BC826DRAFT_1173855 [Russula brevipes]